jgi:hypothetical protein
MIQLMPGLIRQEILEAFLALPLLVFLPDLSEEIQPKLQIAPEQMDLARHFLLFKELRQMELCWVMAPSPITPCVTSHAMREQIETEYSLARQATGFQDSLTVQPGLRITKVGSLLRLEPMTQTGKCSVTPEEAQAF